MVINEHVILIGKTRKGKTRIGQHGKVWKVKQVDASRVLVSPVSNLSDWRWVSVVDDPDFIIERAQI